MPPKDFAALTEAEAMAFLAEHLATAPLRLERFLDRVAATGGPAGRQLDRSPESLVPLHAWFVERARRADARDAAAGLPAWYEPDPPELAAQRLAPRTIADADGVALYFAEVLRRAWPELAWGIGSLPKRMRYAHQHKPVLKAGDTDIDVLGIAYGMGVRVALMGTGREAGALLDVYHAWIDGRTA